MKSLVVLISALLLFSCTQEQEVTGENSATIDKKKTSKKIEWSSRAVPIEDKGWGYQLFHGSQMKVYQKNIPAISGLHYFETKDQAELAANFALQKAKEGFFPPTMNPEELDSIGAINLDSLVLVNEELKSSSSIRTDIQLR